MRVLFAGSPSIAIPSLEAVYRQEGIELAGVLTNSDSPKGRHGTPEPTDVASAAQKMNGVPILKPEKLDASAREQVAFLTPDILVSFAYGHIFGPKFLALFPLGGVNIHPSLLPKYRGPSPIQVAILNRDSVTGVTVQMLAHEMDQGDILAVEKIELSGRETASSLGELAAQKAVRLLIQVLMKIKDGTVTRTAQNHNEASYCKLITRDDALIDWSLSAAQIEAKIRAFDQGPLCRTIHNGRELYILKADIFKGQAQEKSFGQVLGIDKENGILIQTGDGILSVTQLQYQAKKALAWRDFLNGARDFLGSQLGN
ncbi:methionyl-tRNA formyltransferase [Treponema sp. R6D11]